MSELTSIQKIPFWRQIRSNIVLFVIVLLVSSVALVSLSILRRTESQAREQVYNQLESVTELKGAQISAWIEDAQITLAAIPQDSVHRELLLKLVDQPTPANQAIVNQIFADSVNTHNVMENVFIYDLNGTILAAANESEIGKVVRRQSYYNASLSNETSIAPPFYDVGRTGLTMITTQQVLDDNGKLVGIVAGRLNIETLGAIMTERTGLGDTGETYLVSQSNNYLLTPSRSEGYDLNHAYHSEGISKVLQGVDGRGTYANYQSPSDTVLGVYRWIPALQAGILAEVSEAEVLTASRDATRTSVLITLAIITFAVMLALLYAAYVTRPILKLTDVALSVANGDLSQRTHIQRSNEIGLLGQTFDKMTSQLADTISQLNDKVVEVEQANRGLRIASAQAKEAARLKSEFMATMSHELRTPLNAMIGFTGIMLQGMGGEIDDDASHMVTRIESNSKRLLGLINDVLDLAKIEAGRVEIQYEPFNPRAAAEQWRTDTSVLAEQKGLDFEVVVAPNFPETIYGDVARISQVANNLLSNAFKFTEKGKVRLELKLADDQHWMIQVQDSGIGIPPHAQNFIFDEFRQVDGSSRRSYGGSGLGLAITRNLCMMMDGNIRVESSLGQGSTFTVNLPLHVVEPMAEAVIA